MALRETIDQLVVDYVEKLLALAAPSLWLPALAAASFVRLRTLCIAEQTDLWRL